MIHRDLCSPEMTKEYSSKRMQFHFLIARHACKADGLIPLTFKQLATKLKCSLQSVYKYVRKGQKDGIVELCGGRLFLTKRVEHQKQGYVKHFPFLESEEFQTMSLHAQRFVLYCLWYGVHTGRPLKRALTELYHSTQERNGVLNLYTKKELEAVLDESAAFLLTKRTQVMGIDKISVYGLREEYAQQQALSNEGERIWLEKELVKLNCEDLVPETARIDLLRMKQEYIYRFAETGLELFSNALQQLAFSYKLFEMKEEGEIGRYFRSIITEMEKKVLPFLQKRTEEVKRSLVVTDFLRVPQVDRVKDWLQDKLDHLQKAVLFATRHNEPEPAILIEQSEPFYNWIEEE